MPIATHDVPDESDGFFRLARQWMFIIEGLAASVVGVIAFLCHTSRPRDAGWLSADEREALENAIAQEDRNEVAIRTTTSFIQHSIQETTQ
jgi:sugar phosphate permease